MLRVGERLSVGKRVLLFVTGPFCIPLVHAAHPPRSARSASRGPRALGYTFPVVENDEPLPPTQWARTHTRPYLQVGETRYGETCMVTDHHGTGLHSENPHLEPRFPDGRGARGELREVS